MKVGRFFYDFNTIAHPDLKGRKFEIPKLKVITLWKFGFIIVVEDNCQMRQLLVHELH